MKQLRLMAMALLAGGMMFSACEKDDEEDDDNGGGANLGKEVMLVVKPTIGNDAIQLNTNYDVNGQTVSFSDLRFYVSGIELLDDAGTVLADNEGEVILADTEQNGVMIGSTEAEHLHMMYVDMGLDSATNHLSEQDWMNLPMGHPLYPSDMHWGWNPAAGFKFVRMEGTVDGESFASHAATDALFQEDIAVDVHSISTSGDQIHIELQVDFAEALDGLSIMAGSSHGPTQFNGSYMNKFGTGSPFSAE